LGDQLGGSEGVASIPASIFDEKLKWIRRGEGKDFGVSCHLPTLTEEGTVEEVSWFLQPCEYHKQGIVKSV